MFLFPRPLNVLFDQKYFLEIPYDVCKTRRRCVSLCITNNECCFLTSKKISAHACFFSFFWHLIESSRVYTPPDPPGYFDGHVWPMYLKNRQEMLSMVSEIGECPVKGCIYKERDIAVMHHQINDVFVCVLSVPRWTEAEGRAAGGCV